MTANDTNALGLSCTTSEQVPQDDQGNITPAAERTVAKDLLRSLRALGYSGPVEWDQGQVTASGADEPHHSNYVITCTAWRDEATFNAERGA